MEEDLLAMTERLQRSHSRSRKGGLKGSFREWLAISDEAKVTSVAKQLQEEAKLQERSFGMGPTPNRKRIL